MSLEITLTGQLAAKADGNTADATDLPGRQAAVVFAYLVAERDRPVPTEELAEAVWGGALPPTWRPALRGVVSKVRAFLDLLGLPAADTLTSSSGCYRLTLPSDTAVDVELAVGEADTARRALSAGQPQRALAAAGRARTIAARPLLPGHDSAWVEDRRAALHQLLLSCLELLADAHLAAGQAAMAVGPAADLVALEPFRDSAHRRLLAAHAAAGDRGEALRAYDRYRRILAEELGVGPSPELEAAYLELLHAEPADGTVAPVAVPAAGPPPAPGPGAFVGRSTELRRLKAAWADTRAGRRRTMLVAGEAGIGKTRLATELASQAERDGAVVLAGRCDQHLGVPYLPLREAVGRHLASYPSERLRGLLGPRAAELVRFWPELAWRLPALPAPSAHRPGRRPLPAAGGPHRAPGGDRRHRAAAAAGRRPPRRRRGQPAAAAQPGRGPPAGPAADRPDLPGRRARPPGHPDRRPRRPGPRPRGRAADAGRPRRRRGRGDGRGGRRPAARPGRQGPGPRAPRAHRRQPVPGRRAAAPPGRDRRPRRRRRHRGRRRAGRRRRARERPLGRRPAPGPPRGAGRARARARGRDRPAGRADPAAAGRRPRLGRPAGRAGRGRGGTAAGGAAGPSRPLRLPPPDRARSPLPAAAGQRAGPGPPAGRRGARGAHRRRRPPRRAGRPLRAGRRARSPTGRLATPSGRASRPPPTTTTRRRPTATARPWPCWSRPAGPRSTRSAGSSCCAARPTPGPRPARPARPPTPTCWRRRPPARPARPTAWPGPPSGWAARPASGRSTSASRSRPACSARPSTPPVPATARPGPSCWPAWPAGRPRRRTRLGAAAPEAAEPDPAGFAEAVAMARRLGDRADARRGPGRPGDRLDRRPAARAGRRPPWPPRPSWTAWPPSWATTTWPGRRARPGRAPCWPPATWTASTG